MSFKAYDLYSQEYPLARLNGKWGLSQPVVAPFIVRLRWAWKVVRGEAEIIVWPHTGEET